MRRGFPLVRSTRPLATLVMTRLQQITFPLRGDFITLDRLLKACALANSGGQAKLMVADGLVQVDGQQELRKTAKIRAGQVVAMAGARIHVVVGDDSDGNDDGL